MHTTAMFTWNTQGNFTEDDKFDTVRTLFGRGRSVGFIQEGGVGKRGRHGNIVAYGGTGVGAFNERCTNYILVDATYEKFVSVENITLQDGFARTVVGGGEAGRAPAAVSINDELFISWHSLAGRANEDTASLFNALENNDQYKKYKTIVIGGDFNTAPDDIEAMIVRRAAVRGSRNEWFYYIRNSGAITYPHRQKELDFFVVMSKTDLTAHGMLANFKPVERVQVVPSDHHPVCTKLFT